MLVSILKNNQPDNDFSGHQELFRQAFPLKKIYFCSTFHFYSKYAAFAYVPLQ